MIKAGSRVRYTGPDTVAFETGKEYMVVGYDDKLDAFGVMSELDEDYYLAEQDLEEVDP